MTYINRRRFLAASTAGLAGTSLMTGPFGSRRAWGATDTSGYRALVCLFLFGGMDHADTIFPLNQNEYDELADLRSGLFNNYSNGAAANNRARANLLELNPQNPEDFPNRQFGLSPNLSELRDLFDNQELAIVGNVGPLIEATTRTSFDEESVALPSRLFSHNDQQSTWLALNPEGAQLGWGGRFADAVAAADPSTNSTFVSVSTSSNSVFLSGNDIRQFEASSNGSADGLDLLDRQFFLGGNARFDAQRQAVAEFYAQNDFGNQNIFERDFARISANGIETTRDYIASLENVTPAATEFPDTRLGSQLQTIADTIEIRNTLGVSRQVFFASSGGFDTHSGQANRLPQLQTEISQAVAAFRNAMVERGIWENVTLFTASDFGRTVIDNGDGTDHGWGNHHFVTGGSVNGGRIFGEIPRPDVSLPQYTPQSWTAHTKHIRRTICWTLGTMVRFGRCCLRCKFAESCKLHWEYCPGFRLI